MGVVKEKLQEIWDIISLEINKDVYNIDESTLFWKMTSDKILNTKQNIGKTYKKTSIIIYLICSIY